MDSLNNHGRLKSESANTEHGSFCYLLAAEGLGKEVLRGKFLSLC